MSLFLILPDIRSCHNVGAMFRCADAFGVEKIFLTGYTPEPIHRQATKVSLGAEKWIPWEKRPNAIELIKEMKANGIMVVSLEKNKLSTDIGELKISRDLALVVGNEVGGVEDEILALSDYVARIPMIGKKESLNVSVAAGIALYVLSRKMGKFGLS